MRKLTFLLLTIPLALLVSACQATGGGTLTSNDGVHRATFGVVLDTASNTAAGSYQDRTGVLPGEAGPVSVALKSNDLVRLAPPGQTRTDEQCLTATAAAYESTNPKRSGTGTFDLELCDTNGDGDLDDEDTLSIKVLTGPFEGYENERSIKGSIQVH